MTFIVLKFSRRKENRLISTLSKQKCIGFTFHTTHLIVIYIKYRKWKRMYLLGIRTLRWLDFEETCIAKIEYGNNAIILKKRYPNNY